MTTTQTIKKPLLKERKNKVMTVSIHYFRALVVLAALVLAASLLVHSARPAEATFPGQNDKKIVFTSDRDGNHEIYVMSSDGSGTPANLTNHTATDINPVVSPDGTKIAFASSRDGNFEVYTMNSDGTGTPTRLTASPGFDISPAFSPDGSQIAFASERDGNREIYVMDAVDSDGDGNGDNPTNLTNNSAANEEESNTGNGT